MYENFLNHFKACRQQTESSCKRYMANVIYCLAWDSESCILDVLDACAATVPAIQVLKIFVKKENTL